MEHESAEGLVSALRGFIFCNKNDLPSVVNFLSDLRVNARAPSAFKEPK